MKELQTIVFLCSSGLHVKLFASTIRILSEEDALSVTVISLDDFYRDVHGDVSNRVRDLDLQVRLIEPEFGPEVRKGLAGRVSAASKSVAAIESIYASCGAALLVLGNDTGHAERAALRAARRRGIPTLLVQDGFLFNRFGTGIAGGLPLSLFRLWIFLGGRRFGAIPYGMGGCDVIAVHGTAWVAMMERCCRREETRIEVTGHPALALASSLSLKSDEARCVTFFCTNYLSGHKDPAAHRAQLDEILVLRQMLTRRFGDVVRLAVKPHPADRPEDYGSLHGIPGISICSNMNAVELVRSSWFCMTNISSVSLECLVEGRICLMSGVNLQKHSSYRRLFASLPGIKFTDWQTCSDRLETLRSESGYENMLKSQLDALQPWVGNVADGSGSKRLADLIFRMAKG